MGGTSTDVSRYAGSYEQVLETQTAGVIIQVVLSLDLILPPWFPLDGAKCMFGKMRAPSHFSNISYSSLHSYMGRSKDNVISNRESSQNYREPNKVYKSIAVSPLMLIQFNFDFIGPAAGY